MSEYLKIYGCGSPENMLILLKAKRDTFKKDNISTEVFIFLFIFVGGGWGGDSRSGKNGRGERKLLMGKKNPEENFFFF